MSRSGHIVVGGLRFKFVIAISAALVLTLALTAFYIYQLQQKQLINGLNDKTNSIGNFIALISPKAIYSFDITTLDLYVERIASDIDISFALIRNSSGITMTTASPHNFSFNQIADLIDSKENALNNIDIYTFPIKDGNTLLGDLVIAVDNSRLIAINKNNFKKLLIIDLITIIFLASIIFIIFHINVLKPVKNLMLGANKVSQGNFDFKVPVTSRDELSQLASCFNHMIQQISSEQDKLKQANISLNNEIEQRKLAENQMKLAASVFSHSREGIVITDTHAKIIEVNEAFTAITGYGRDEVLGKNPRFMQSGNHDKDFYRMMWNNLNQHGYWSGEIWNKRKNGESVVELLTISAVKDSANEIKHFVALFSDITDQIKHQKQLEQIAHYDSLTGLPNRMLLSDRLNQAITQAHRRKQAITIAYLDLDGFKKVNDTHGHDLGDQLLVTISQRMSDCLRDSDTIARLGGDEFIAVLIDSDIIESKISLDRLLMAASQPVRIENIVIQVTASIGVTSYPQDKEIDADQLVRQADQAMYRAKLEGKNRYYQFDPEEDQNLRGHLEKVERIRLGLENNEFKLYYQPKVNLRTGKIIGAEALIRWEHPEDGLLPPGYFLPLIEQHPLSVTLGEWVINSALFQLQEWRKKDLDISVSINIGAYHIQKDNFVQRLKEQLDKYDQFDVKRLQIEVLETSTLDIVRVAQTMHQCLEMGVDFALDDFGTGYSSLTYLKHLPASVIKIDRSFVRDMLEDPEDLAIVEGVIGLAQAFRREVVAEGVETMEHAEILLMIGCDLVQGYAIAHPMPAEDLPAWSEKWSPPADWKKIPYIHKRDPQLLLLLVEHRAWVAEIQNVINDNQNKYPELDGTKCSLSHWLNNEGKKLYQNNPEFNRIQLLHTEIHTRAQQMIKKHQLQKYDLIEEDLISFQDTHKQLLNGIKKLLTIVQTVN